MALARAEMALEISEFIAAFYAEHARSDAEGAVQYFAEDGVMNIVMKPVQGREAIKEVFQWRNDQGRTSRHLITNLRYDFSEFEKDQTVTVLACDLHYGADGIAPVTTRLPIGIYDLLVRVRRTGDQWRIVLYKWEQPVFLAEDHLMMRYPGWDKQ